MNDEKPDQWHVTASHDEKREFMRAFVIAMAYVGKFSTLGTVLDARIAWDAIEAEAAR